MGDISKSGGTDLPILKWAGGKRWLASKYSGLFPAEYNRYFEPFLGGAAVFFHLKPPKAFLSDINAELINVYKAIRDDWAKVANALRRHDKSHSKAHYYDERDRTRRVSHERAAQLIYLNRTCWNGLYRVNLEGRFNVPIGTKTAVVLETDNFARTAKLFSRVDLRVADFEPALNEARKGDFAFLDPPYVTRHNYNGFAKYNEAIFTWNDQVRLAACIRRAAARGVMILVTNANHHSIKNLYVDLFEGNAVFSLQRPSILAASSKQRGLVSEMALAINYEPSL